MRRNDQNSRRSFIRSLSIGSCLLNGLPALASAAATEKSRTPPVTLQPGATILFQGDSITDWNRKQDATGSNHSAALGGGYVLLTAGDLLRRHPKKNLTILNKGISGNTLKDLDDRWEADCLSLKPDVLSVLIGTNDFMTRDRNTNSGTPETYKAAYGRLLDRTLTALPNVKLLIAEPFSVKGLLYTPLSWYPAFDAWRQAAKEVAEKYNAVYIPLQGVLDKAQGEAPSSTYWSGDGIHPSLAGAALLAGEWLKVFKLVILLFTALIGAASTAGATPPKTYDVKDFGAIGDGRTADDAAIQKAIDACSQDHGGLVLVDNGVFLINGITLKSNVELHLTASATLLGSTDYRKYPQDNQFAYKYVIRSLIYAQGCRQIAITGEGRIDGQGKSIKVDSASNRPDLIVLHNCIDVRIEKVFITNSNMFGVFILNCEKLRIDGVRLENLQCPNNDGFDIDGCRDVFISHCYINTVDDCLAFKSSSKQTACSDIMVSDCLLTSRCAAIRFGPDALGDIENVVVTNCIIRNTGLNGIKIQESLGARMRNMTFSNIVMDKVKGPISIRLAGWSAGPYVESWTFFDDKGWEKGQLQNILFDNIRATVPRVLLPRPEFAGLMPGWLNLTQLNLGMSITGTTRTRPQGITFSNIDISFAGGGAAAEGERRHVPDMDRAYPEMYMFGELPAYGLYMHHASGIVLNNVTFRLDSADLRPAIVCDDVDDLELSGFKAEGNKRSASLIRLENTRNVFITGSRALNQTGRFLLVEGALSRDIKMGENKLGFIGKVNEGSLR